MAARVGETHSTSLMVSVRAGVVRPVFIHSCIHVINSAPIHKVIWGNGYIDPKFLTSVVDEGKWSASRSYRFNTR